MHLSYKEFTNLFHFYFTESRRTFLCSLENGRTNLLFITAIRDENCKKEAIIVIV